MGFRKENFVINEPSNKLRVHMMRICEFSSEKKQSVEVFTRVSPKKMSVAYCVCPYASM